MTTHLTWHEGQTWSNHSAQVQCLVLLETQNVALSCTKIFVHTHWLPRQNSGKEICPTMQEMKETLDQSLGWEDCLEEEMTTHSSILPGKSQRQRRVGYSPWGCKESDTTEWLSTHACTHTHIFFNTKMTLFIFYNLLFYKIAFLCVFICISIVSIFPNVFITCV